MANQHEIEALIVDTPFHEHFKQFGIKPQAENKEKIMPPVLTHLVDKDIIKLFEETWESKARNCSRYPKSLSIVNLNRCGIGGMLLSR